MAEEVNEEAASEAGRKLRSRNGVPRVSLETIEASVKAIWNVARRGEAAPVTVARAITGKVDAKASGGAWQKRVAALRTFNVIERGSNFKLSSIGLAIANSADVEGHAKGLRDAVLSIPAYEKFLGRAEGGELPTVALLASDLEFEYELSNADAVNAANVFVQSATYAGFVDEEGNVTLAGATPPQTTDAEDVEAASDEVESAPTSIGTAPPPPSQADARPVAPATVAAPSAAPVPPEVAVATPVVPEGAGPVSLKVKIDMTQWAADDVVKVLEALGYGNQVSDAD